MFLIHIINDGIRVSVACLLEEEVGNGKLMTGLDKPTLMIRNNLRDENRMSASICSIFEPWFQSKIKSLLLCGKGNVIVCLDFKKGNGFCNEFRVHIALRWMSSGALGGIGQQTISSKGSINPPAPNPSALIIHIYFKIFIKVTKLSKWSINVMLVESICIFVVL